MIYFCINNDNLISIEVQNPITISLKKFPTDNAFVFKKIALTIICNKLKINIQ